MKCISSILAKLIWIEGSSHMFYQASIDEMSKLNFFAQLMVRLAKNLPRYAKLKLMSTNDPPHHAKLIVRLVKNPPNNDKLRVKLAKKSPHYAKLVVRLTKNRP